MTPVAESLHDEIIALRKHLDDLRIDLIRLEAKIDSKPSFMAMFAGIVVLVFSMAGVIASTVAVLHALNFFR